MKLLFLIFFIMMFGSPALAEYPQQNVRNVYSVTPVTTSAFVTLVSLSLATINWAYIFDSSGQTLGLYIGPVGSEVLQTIIPPGGGTLPFGCPQATRISIKAISATASAGELDITFH